jgi:hypothetical protein
MLHALHWFSVLPYAALVALYVCLFAVCYYGWMGLPARRRRWVKAAHASFEATRMSGWLFRTSMVLLRINPNEGPWEQKRRLLDACGVRIDMVMYELWRRCLLAMVLLVGGVLLLRPEWLPGGVNQTVALELVCAVIAIFLSTDRIWLETLSRRRAQRIVRDIYSVSQQLLYYADSRMNLHGKLQRCLPHAVVMRREMETLLNDWYENPEEALRAFRVRLATDEGYSFAETLNSIRMNEHTAYYELLRQRLADYKEKLDLFRDSRKETTSYLLFTLAGIPILFTFRVFLYPWVIEGQKLFEALN